MTSMYVSYGELVEAAGLWTDQADALHGAAGALREADVACLAPRVQLVAATFLGEWGPVIDDHETDARDHGDDLQAFADDTFLTDEAVSGDVAALLPRGAGS